MIKYIKTVHYEKGTASLGNDAIEKRSFYTLEDAINYLKKTDLKYYYNKNNISCYEEASLFYKEGDSYKQLYKTINYDGKILTNLESDSE
jgi:hypothetical protein